MTLHWPFYFQGEKEQRGAEILAGHTPLEMNAQGWPANALKLRAFGGTVLWVVVALVKPQTSLKCIYSVFISMLKSGSITNVQY